MGKFTPGPWVIYPVSANSESCDIVKQSDPNDRIAVTCPQSTDGVELANGRMLASAPEMYGELGRAEKHLRDVVTFLKTNKEQIGELTAIWDDTECDGCCLLDEAEGMLDDIERTRAKARGEA